MVNGFLILEKIKQGCMLEFKNLIKLKDTFLFMLPVILSISCQDNSFNKPKTDFIKFDLNTTRMYEFKDSVFQICSPSNFYQNKYDFYINKNYNSNDSEFQSMSLTIRYLDGTCPVNELQTNSEFTFTLSKEAGKNDFVDFLNFGKLYQIDWTQEFSDGKIVLKGNFEGWLYQYFSTRKTGFGIEPNKLDSIFLSDGTFQFTLN
jgi:hypothetical protein